MLKITPITHTMRVENLLKIVACSLDSPLLADKKNIFAFYMIEQLK